MLAQFQETCLTHAVYPDLGFNIIYPTFGLIGELGELYDKLTLPQYDISSHDLGELIRKEVGDVMWYTAMLGYEAGADLGDLESVIIPPTLKAHALQSATVITCILDACRLAESIKKFIRDNGYAPGELLDDEDMKLRIWKVVANNTVMMASLAASIGSSLKEVLDMNSAKIASRAERGVLQGSGDNR